MDSCKPEEIFALIPGFEQGSKKLARSIHDTALGNKTMRCTFDALHGVWLKHPLHPALTDFVVGAWLFGSILDGITLTRRSRGMEDAADTLICLGNALAVPTALAGMADYSTVPQKSAATAATHALLNAGGLVLNTISSIHRNSGKRRLGMCLSAIASTTLFVSAWLGGKLTFEQKVGVNKIPEKKMKNEWKSTIRDNDLQDKPIRIDVDGTPAMLYRSGNAVQAMCPVCAHEGGPLEQGQFDHSTVTCPWHQSVFNLKTGHVVHGPSTYSEPVYETRNTEGMLEIKGSGLKDN